MDFFVYNRRRWKEERYINCAQRNSHVLVARLPCEITWKWCTIGLDTSQYADCPTYLPRQCGTLYNQKWDNLGPRKHSDILFANYFNGCYNQTIRAYCLFQNLQPYNSQFLCVQRSKVQGKVLNFYFFYAVPTMINVAPYFFLFLLCCP